MVCKGDDLVSASIDNGEIKVIIELASDELLNHEGWDTLTVEYVDIGKISMDRSQKESNEYENFPTDKIGELLGVEY